MFSLSPYHILQFQSVVYWSKFLATDLEATASIPGATTFSKK
jgi:hypothetical protein